MTAAGGRDGAGVRIACVQLAPVVGDPAGNAARSVRAVADAVAAGADLVVLPELVTSGYVFAGPREARAAAIRADDALLRAWAGAAGSAVVVGGFCELGDGGLLHNSAAVVAGGEVLAVHRKVHLWDAETLVFTPGSAPPPVVRTRIGAVGVLVCYDLEFPELTRGLARAGADVVAVPTNWPLQPRPAGERAPEVVVAMAAARVNRMAIACCDRGGTERGQAWTERSTIGDVDGWVVAEAAPPSAPAGVPVTGDGPGGAAVVRARIDLAAARDKSLSPRNHALDDRRPDVYAAFEEQLENQLEDRPRTVAPPTPGATP